MFHHAQKCNQAAAPFGFWCKFQLKFIVFLFKLAEWYHLFTAIDKLSMRNRLCVAAWAMVQLQAKTCVKGEKMKINYINGMEIGIFCFFAVMACSLGAHQWSPLLTRPGKLSAPVLTFTHAMSTCTDQSEPVWTSPQRRWPRILRPDQAWWAGCCVITHQYSGCSVPTTLKRALHTEQPVSSTIYSWTL